MRNYMKHHVFMQRSAHVFVPLLSQTGFLVSVVVLVLLLSGCSKDGSSGGGLGGSDIRFTVGSPYVSTKAFYGLPVGTGKTPIRWELDDVLRIYYPEAASQKYSDYKVSSLSDNDTKASISNVGSNGLQWNSNAASHNFYGLYPAPTSGNGGAMDDLGFTVSIPQSQGIKDITTKSGVSGDSVFINPVMDRSAWLYGKTSSSTAGSTVSLRFSPCFTAFTFILSAGSNSNVTINSFSITSEKFSMSGSGSFAHTSPSVMTQYPSEIQGITVGSINTALNVVANAEDKIIVTVFALPHTYGGASSGDFLKIEFDTSIGKRSLRLLRNNAPIEFLPFKKYIIKNLTLPEQGLTLDLGDNILWDAEVFDIEVADFIDWDGSGLDATSGDNINFDDGTILIRGN